MILFVSLTPRKLNFANFADDVIVKEASRIPTQNGVDMVEAISLNDLHVSVAEIEFLDQRSPSLHPNEDVVPDEMGGQRHVYRRKLIHRRIILENS